MRRTFFLGALALSLSGSALVPALAESSRASTQFGELQTASPSTEVAIREAGGNASSEDPLIQLGPELPIAPLAIPTAKVIRAFQGQASWYGPGLYGNRTSSGEVLRPGTFTAAHRSLPFGTKVRVTNMANGKTAMVRINDRGPFHGNRVIDIAHGAANQLGLTASGLAPVKLEVIQ
ncbi:septal ring lytic transglycosylase RlpA family protein [Cyanobium sp. HWJ4-Hawea]|uniref:septal ring lytic transglycosylase RlpA family protein n=1 Tax=unclassified Cyanobium TaxID=2627006 RepID=UPI0020CEFD92|nr:MULTISPECIES: septal ring lytic transglycosylase RlpA family protein [unclassified Cyanobium]MCP9775982.1 septal ring lytic transglycosylase RlpA family protein [Cyanobium sp. WAJ14-Wanaka]MCP9809780.1 septal ring lytic transglycosylase RlpA family protein [Cyanobium sp. HWJ4-Hawea]